MRKSLEELVSRRLCPTLAIALLGSVLAYTVGQGFPDRVREPPEGAETIPVCSRDASECLMSLQSLITETGGRNGHIYMRICTCR